jgi:hypothetical protein
MSSRWKSERVTLQDVTQDVRNQQATQCVAEPDIRVLWDAILLATRRVQKCEAWDW